MCIGPGVSPSGPNCMAPMMTHEIRPLRAFTGAAVSCVLFSLCAFAQKGDAIKKLDNYLSEIGAKDTDQRAQTVAGIHTRAEMEHRQAEVRKKILDSIGGLP